MSLEGQTVALSKHDMRELSCEGRKGQQALQPTCFVSLLRAQMTMMSANVALPIQRFRPLSTQPPSTCPIRTLALPHA